MLFVIHKYVTLGTPKETVRNCPQAQSPNKSSNPYPDGPGVLSHQRIINCALTVININDGRIMTKSTSSNIFKHKDREYFLNCRLAGFSCLIPAEVCYHTLCYAKSLKSIAALECSSESCTFPMKQACFRVVMDEFQVRLNKGNVFTVKLSRTAT